MAKQSKSARADSSAGRGAAAVSSNTDAVATAEPATPKAPDATVDHAVADDTVLDKAALLAVIKDMAEDLPPMIAELEANARLSAQSADHSEHAMYARLVSVFGEFRAGLASVSFFRGGW